MEKTKKYQWARWAARSISIICFFPLLFAGNNFSVSLVKYWHWKANGEIKWEGLLIKVPPKYAAVRIREFLEDGFTLMDFKADHSPLIFFEKNNEYITSELFNYKISKNFNQIKEIPCAIEGLNCRQFISKGSAGRVMEYELFFPQKNIRINSSAPIKDKMDLTKMIFKAS